MNKVPFRIVPGITAGVAGLAYAGIPATHRDFNTSVTFISAYGAGGEKPETIDWKNFTQTSQLIIVYMGLQRIHWVCNELILKGREQNESIAIISNATKTNQKIFIDTLLNCSKKHVLFSASFIEEFGIASATMLRMGLSIDVPRYSFK